MCASLQNDACNKKHMKIEHGYTWDQSQNFRISFSRRSMLEFIFNKNHHHWSQSRTLFFLIRRQNIPNSWSRWSSCDLVHTSSTYCSWWCYYMGKRLHQSGGLPFAVLVDGQQTFCTSAFPWTPKPWNMKVLNPQYMGVTWKMKVLGSHSSL